MSRLLITSLSVSHGIDNFATMIRIIGVVAAFVVLNASGFVVYRELHTTDASAGNPAAAPPANQETLARPPVASQPKPIAPEKTVVVEPETPPPIDASSTDNSKNTVSEHTKSPVDVPSVHSPKPLPPRPRAAEIVRPVAPAKTAAAPAKPAPETKPDTAKEKEKDKVLEMEGNPYKRGE
jgi:hypothetical protein